MRGRPAVIWAVGPSLHAGILGPAGAREGPKPGRNAAYKSAMIPPLSGCFKRNFGLPVALPRRLVAPQHAVAIWRAAAAHPFYPLAEMALDSKQVRHIAQLARIAVSDDELALVCEELNGIFGLIEKMRAVDTAGVEQMAHAQELVLRLRDDKVTEVDQREHFQSIAPAVDSGLYLVPAVIERVVE